jgi:hypothetical protein
MNTKLLASWLWIGFQGEDGWVHGQSSFFDSQEASKQQNLAGS